jgi:hypothetical protein
MTSKSRILYVETRVLVKYTLLPPSIGSRDTPTEPAEIRNLVIEAQPTIEQLEAIEKEIYQLEEDND